MIFLSVTEELVDIQIKIQIAGSVAKFANRRKYNNGFTDDVSMYSGVPQRSVKMPVSICCSFQRETAKFHIKLVHVSSTGTLNSIKCRYIVKRNSL